MTQEQQEKVEEIYNSLPNVIGPIAQDYKYISKEVLISVVDHMITTAVYDAKMESLDEFRNIVEETFN
jgi:hypothetical protein